MNIFDSWHTWNSMMRTGMMMAETLDASRRVIGVRSGTIASAMSDPFAADHAELARMVQEKALAFSQAGAVMATSWMRMQGDLAAASLKALRPIHKTATANYRRLRQR